MATHDAEPVAGPSHCGGHVMPMTSQLPLCVQLLNYDDFDDVVENGDSGSHADIVRVDDILIVADDSTTTSTNVFTSPTVLIPLLRRPLSVR